MRIAFFTDDYLPSIHGVTRSTQAFREALEARGHEVFIVAPSQAGYEDNDDHVIRVPAFQASFFEGRSAALVYPGVARRFDEYQFDVVHTQTQFWLGIIGYHVAKRQHIPHVTTMHTIFPELLAAYPALVLSGAVLMAIIYPIAFTTTPVLPVDRTSLERLRSSNKEHFDHLFWKVMNLFMNHTSLTIAPSQHVADILVSHGLNAPVGILPTGIDTELYHGPQTDTVIPKSRGERWIVAVGRLSAEKRQSALISSITMLADPSVKLILMGEGPAEAELKQQVASLGLQDRVLFTGVQPRHTVAAMLNKADIFSLASYRFDTQAMVLLEAAAAGLPIVYCDDHLTVGLTPQNALLTSTPEPEGFSEAFQVLLDDPDRRKAMGKASRKLSTEFDIKKQAGQLEQMYRAAKPLD